MDERLLVGLGLNDTEQKLYNVVLIAQSLAPAELAKRIGVKRTTAYSMARGLVEKGLLVEDTSTRPRLFRPATAGDLSTVIEIEKKRSQERQALLKKVAEEVSLANVGVEYPVPRIRFIEESKLDQYLTAAFPAWFKSMRERDELVLWGFQDATLVEHFEHQLHAWWKLAPDDAHVQLLTNLAAGEKNVRGQYERRHLKYWGEATDFITSTWIAGDYMVMINTRTRPFYAIEIHSRPLAHDQREVFRNLWELV